jgi:hypothetical protein
LKLRHGTAANVQTVISTREGTITGNFDEDIARTLARRRAKSVVFLIGLIET